MGQLGFFDADKRLEALSARGDPLEAIDRLVPWESFRAEIEAVVVLTPDELKKSSAGRKPFDSILTFRMLVLQALNNLSDERGAAERAGRSHPDDALMRGRFVVPRRILSLSCSSRLAKQGTGAPKHHPGAPIRVVGANSSKRATKPK